MTDLADRPAEEPREDLCARLLAGRVTEVCVLTRRGLAQDLPQTLGLEVIDFKAYQYDSFGVARPPEERERFARELAAEDRWLAIGGPRYWVEPFARRAEVIIVIPGSPAADFDFAVNAGVAAALDYLSRGLRAALDRLRRQAPEPVDRHDRPDFLTRLADSMGEPIHDGQMSGPELDAYFVRMRNYFVGEFPDKTIVLESREDVRDLRSVRALPRT